MTTDEQHLRRHDCNDSHQGHSHHFSQSPDYRHKECHCKGSELHKERLKYEFEDSKFTKISDGCKKMKMSESFLAAKAKCTPHGYDNNFLTDTTLSGNGQSFSKRDKFVAGRFVCKHEGCGQSFHSRKDLRRHKLVHRVRKHVCPIEGCGRAFFEKSKLKRHMVVHTKKKEYSCPICGKKFGYKANVKTHMRTHTGERPFKCRIKGCNKTFAQASNRNAHEKTHFKTPEERRKLKESQAQVKYSRKRKLSQSIEDEDDISDMVVRRSSRLQSKKVENTKQITGIPISIFKGTETETDFDPSSLAQEQQFDFDDFVNDISKIAPLSKSITKHGSKSNLFSEPPPNVLFNSFTSFTSGVYPDNNQATDLGLSIDAIDNELLSFGDTSHNTEFRIGPLSKTLQTPSRINSKDIPSAFGFPETSNLEMSASFLSTKFNIGP